MKRILAFLIIASLMLMILPVFAGDGTFTSGKNATWIKMDQGRIIQFECTVDAVDTLTSNPFTLAKYDKDSFSTYPIPYGYIASSVAGNVKITVHVYGSYDNTSYFVIDTICTDETSETYAKGTQDWNNVKCPYYKLYIYGITGNNADTTFKLRLYIYRPED